MSKLIYFTLGYNVEYLNLTKLCVESLYKNGYDGDFLFISEFEDKILENIEFIKKPYFLFSKNENVFQSSANKFKIYKFDQINNFEKVLFCDSDILFLKNPDNLFDRIKENKIYLCKETDLMSHELWGGNLIDDLEKNEIEKKQIYGMNAGLFGFKNNMIDIFEKIEDFMLKNMDKGNACLEQPFLNVYLYRNNLYDDSFSDEVTAKGYHMINFEGTAIHFTTDSGNYFKKIEKMINFKKQNNL
jgi:hypothetical protein